MELENAMLLYAVLLGPGALMAYVCFLHAATSEQLRQNPLPSRGYTAAVNIVRILLLVIKSIVYNRFKNGVSFTYIYF